MKRYNPKACFVDCAKESDTPLKHEAGDPGMFNSLWCAFRLPQSKDNLVPIEIPFERPSYCNYRTKWHPQIVSQIEWSLSQQYGTLKRFL